MKHIFKRRRFTKHLIDLEVGAEAFLKFEHQMLAFDLRHQQNMLRSILMFGERHGYTYKVTFLAEGMLVRRAS